MRTWIFDLGELTSIGRSGDRSGWSPDQPIESNLPKFSLASLYFHVRVIFHDCIIIRIARVHVVMNPVDMSFPLSFYIKIMLFNQTLNLLLINITIMGWGISETCELDLSVHATFHTVLYIAWKKKIKREKQKMMCLRGCLGELPVPRRYQYLARGYGHGTAYHYQM